MQHLSFSQEQYYNELLAQTEKLLTNKKSTGIIDNTQSALQDQQQTGQLDYVIIALCKLFERIDTLQTKIDTLALEVKGLKTIKPGTFTPSSSSEKGANIGTTFITYNPPDK